MHRSTAEWARAPVRAILVGKARPQRQEPKMKNTIAVLAVTLVWMAGGSTAAMCAEPSADEAATLGEALTGGKLLLNLRPRYEYVEQANKPKDANAFTMRTLLGWRTKPWHGLSVTAEGINVTHFGEQDYNDLPSQAAASPYPTVADPDMTGINQLYLQYLGVPKTDAKVGWQSIKLDNVRFIGNVEFRQVMQVFDAVSVENKSIDKLTLYAAYFWRQRNISNQQISMDMPVFNARYTWKPGNDVVGYAYLQDQPRTGQSTGLSDNSNQIYGIRANGGYPLSEKLKLLYTAEYATQSDYADGDSRIDADYTHLGAGPQFGDWFVRFDYELLGSNDGLYGFQTPLGTNHLFQGWADQFLTTPRQGIEDTYLAAGGKLWGLSLYVELHKFASDVGGIDLGNELDIGLTYPMPFLKGLTGKLEYADYNAGDPVPGDTLANKVDVRKFWATLIYQF
jgi:hypothetical protein